MPTTTFTSASVCVIEDDIELAQNLVRQSKIDELMSSITYITDDDTASNFILDSKELYVCIIDINLGEGREEAGIEIIKVIRGAVKNALIIVHTGNVIFESQCIDAGADHFFRKGSPSYKETMAKMYSIVLNYLLQNGVEIKIEEYKAQIAHITKDWIKLECHYNDQVYDRLFLSAPIRFALGTDLKLDAFVKVRIIQKYSEVKMSFEKVDFQQAHLDDENPLFNSEIWS